MASANGVAVLAKATSIDGARRLAVEFHGNAEQDNIMLKEYFSSG